MKRNSEKNERKILSRTSIEPKNYQAWNFWVYRL